MVLKNGYLKNHFITAEIIFFATKKIIAIKEAHKKVFLFDTKDYEITRLGNAEAEAALHAGQRGILDGIFSGGASTVPLSSLKNEFYKKLPQIKKEVMGILEEKNLFVANSSKIATVMIVISVFGTFISLFLLTPMAGSIGFFMALSFLIGFLFGLLMPRRTAMGAELAWQAKGFKLFMETVDKDRAPFYEKENIFEKFLPYAILFDMTGQWIKRMRELYGEDYYTAHPIVWYGGGATTFDADSFSHAMTSLSASITSGTSSPSGSGGSGSSGGGGGGGGGGGW